jgi:hypothetical protein
MRAAFLFFLLSVVGELRGQAYRSASLPVFKAHATGARGPVARSMVLWDPSARESDRRRRRRRGVRPLRHSSPRSLRMHACGRAVLIANPLLEVTVVSFYYGTSVAGNTLVNWKFGLQILWNVRYTSCIHIVDVIFTKK